MICWEVHAPPGHTAPAWLDEIAALRGRILYECGRRPAFRRADGRFADPDPLDIFARHILARHAGQLIGCVRLLVLDTNVTGVTEGLLGHTRFMDMLETLGATRHEAIEGGRWMADPDYRGARIGLQLAIGGIALARAFGFKVLFCPVGTRSKQDRILARIGLKPVPNVPLIAAPAFDDELRVMHIFPAHPPPHIAELMDAMAAELGLCAGEDAQVQQPVESGIGECL